MRVNPYPEKLTPADINNASATVLTIEDYREVVFDDRDRSVLEFSEFPDRVLWLNNQDVRSLVGKLGNESSDWHGQRCPILRIRTYNPRTGEPAVVLHVAPVEEWDNVIAEYDGTASSQTDAPAPRKTSRRRRG